MGVRIAERHVAAAEDAGELDPDMAVLDEVEEQAEARRVHPGTEVRLGHVVEDDRHRHRGDARREVGQMRLRLEQHLDMQAVIGQARAIASTPSQLSTPPWT